MTRCWSQSCVLLVAMCAQAGAPAQPTWAEASPAPAASVDGVSLARRQALGVSLQWDNLREQSAAWAGGVRPRALSRWGGVHAVELAAGRAVVLRLAPGGWLRIEALDRTGAAPRVALSNGTGVAIERRWERGADGRSWLLRNDLPQTVLAHVDLAAAGAPRRFALFLARHEAAESSMVYPRELPLPGPVVALRRADEALARPHTRLAAAQPVALEIEGPVRLRLQARLESALDVGPGSALLSLAAALDGRALALAADPSGPDDLLPMQVDGRWRPVARVERFWLDIPSGPHALVLTPSHTVLARLDASNGPALAWPGRNLPRAWHDLPGDERVQALQRAAVDAAASNLYRDIGRLAAARFARETQPEGLADLRTAAAELEELGGQWRALEPADPSHPGGDPSPPVQAARTLSRTVQAPAERPRGSLVPSGVVLDRRTPMLFHRVDTDARRYRLADGRLPTRLRVTVLDPAQQPAELELHDDAGRRHRITVGALPLPEALLRPEPAALETGLARLSTAPWRASGDAELWLPAGTRWLTLRPLQGAAAVALSYRSSAELPLDDELAAAAWAGRASPFAARLAAARQPVERLARAALAESTANAAPAPLLAAVDPVIALEAQARAALAPDAVRAYEAWSLALRSPDPVVRRAALHGQTAALFAAQERYLAEQSLRAQRLSPDPVLAGAAREALAALHQRDDDGEASMLLAATEAARDDAAYGPLALALARLGEDRLALSAALAATPDPELLGVLLGSALREGQHASFAALLGGLDDPAEAAQWRGQRALWWNADEALAAREFAAAGATDWAAALGEARRIADGLRGPVEDQRAAVEAWTSWQQRHPGPRLWRSEPQALRGHGGAVTLRSIARELRAPWWRASELTPLEIELVGPLRLRVEARPLHGHAQALLDGWLQVEAAGQRWLQPFNRNRPSPGLVIDGEPGGSWVGERVARVIELPAGLHRLAVHAGAMPIAARFEVERPALQLPLLPAPQASHFQPGRQIVGTPRQVAGCGRSTACLLQSEGERLSAVVVDLADQPAPALPVPVAARDAAAARLAAGDALGAIEQTSDPAEQMRLLAWLAEQRPAERGHALARGTALRKQHDRAELLDAWDRLNGGSVWTPLPLVARSAGLRAVPTSHGAPDSPGARLRAAMLPPLRPDEVRLTGDVRAQLRVVDARAAALDIELTADRLPGLPWEPLRLRIDLDGRPVETVVLDAPERLRRVTLRVRAGEHRVAVGLIEPYPNQFVRVRFGGTPPVLRTRDWQIATAAEPVVVSMAGPAWLRVDTLAEDGRLRSEERLLDGPLSTLTLGPRPGERETLYRLAVRRPAPVATVPQAPRPNRYQPDAVPEAPTAWQPPAAMADGGALRFADAWPIAQANDFTWSPRLAWHSRRDTSAGGGGAGTPLEHFAEAGLRWQRRSEDGTRWRSAELLTRSPRAGEGVLGVRLAAVESIDWSDDLPYPFELAVALNSFIQSTPAGQGISIGGRLALAQRREIAANLAHRPTAQAFVRGSNLHDLPATLQDRIDADVYTRYRDRHRWGLEVSDTLAWSPWRDTLLTAGGGLTSNENLTIDHLRGELRARQMAGNWTLEAGWRITRYLSDRDRASASSVAEPSLKVRREWWRSDGRRLELRLQLQRDSVTRSTVGGIELVWHESAGRGLFDLATADRDFADLRSWRMPRSRHQLENLP